MGKRNLCLLLLAAVCIVSLLTVTATLTFQRGSRTEPVVDTQPLLEDVSPPQPITEVKIAAYTIGIWQGRVAVFENNTETPVTVLDTPVTALPIADQKALEQGIPVSDPVTLAGLLEDYGS